MTGCGLVGGDGKGGSGLAGALKEVSAKGPAAQYFEYGDFTVWRRLGVLTANGSPRSRWQAAVGAGASDLYPAAQPMAEATGIEVYKADSAVTIGRPPNSATRLDGHFNAKTIKAKLQGMGARPRKIAGKDGLSLAADHVTDPKSKPAQWGLVNQLDQVVPTDSVVATGAAANPVAAALGSGDSLAGSDDHAAVADCLGDVATATIETPPAASAQISLIGAGLRTPKNVNDTAVNVLCVATKGNGHDAVAQTLRTRLALSQTLSESGEPISGRVSAIKQDEVDSHGQKVLRVVLTLRDTAPVTLAQTMLTAGDLGFLTE